MNVVLSINNPCKNPQAIQTNLNKVEDTNVAQFNEDGTSRTSDFGPVFDPLYIQIQAGDPITIYYDLLDLYTQNEPQIDCGPASISFYDLVEI